MWWMCYYMEKIIQWKSSCGVIVKTQNVNILLATCYMPTDTMYDTNNCEEYNSILQEIIGMSRSLNVQNVIIGGDLNTALCRHNSLHTKALIDFCSSNNYSVWYECTGDIIDYTFESKITFSKSCIDHFLISRSFASNISECKVMHDGANLSDHDPIGLILDIPVSHCTESPTLQAKSSVQWAKASKDDIAAYQLSLDNILFNLVIPKEELDCRDPECINVFHHKALDTLCSGLISSCIEASVNTIPCNSSSKSNVSPVAGSNDQVQPFKQDAIFWHRIWI